MTTLGQAIRRVRGNRSRRVFLREVERKSGVAITEGALQQAEYGHTEPGLSRTARALGAAYPELMRFFLPENIYRAIAYTAPESTDEKDEA